MFQITPPNINIVFLILIIWEAFWKGIGLWRSAKRGEILWFVAIFLINFFGFIPLFYLFYTKQLNPAIQDILKFLKNRK